MTRRHLYIAAGATLAAIVVAGTIFAMTRKNTPDTNVNRSASTPLVNEATLASLPKKKASAADTSRIEKGIIPPTNSWISGLVLQKTPQPVYPLPLTYVGTDAGFEVGLPTITSQPEAIFGQHTPGMMTSISGANGFVLERFDKVSATLRYNNTADAAIGRVTITRGSPYVFYESAAASTVTINNVGDKVTVSKDKTSARYTKQGMTYAVKLQTGSLKVVAASIVLSIPKDSLASLYALPGSDARDPLQASALNRITSVKTAYAQTGDSYKTTMQYQTNTNKPSVAGVLPYQRLESASDPVITYATAYGDMPLYLTQKLTVSAPIVRASNALDLSKLTAAQRAELTAQLARDVDTTVIDKDDSYFAGKQLARAATLLDIAEQLNQDAASKQLKQMLQQAFEDRLNDSYFYYDTTLRGIAATNKAFGSEDFNDHHFHYGYFIYAASILGKYDPEFLDKHASFVNILVADIAAYSASDDFALQRNYDPYAGHSWAAGLAPFADGNNQESSSEAIHAWNGVSLWGSLIKDKQLTQSAQWMLANETVAAAKTWRNPGKQTGPRANYVSPVVDINFGGKRVYATFFSGDPSAKLGIQLLPLSPVMWQFSEDGDAIRTIVGATVTNDNFSQPLGDYVLMYFALDQPERALPIARTLQATAIDDGNSKTYLLAWIFAVNSGN